MQPVFSVTRQVEFYETDLAGLMHFSNFFRWMEATEMAFYRSLGLSAVGLDPDRPTGLPRVHASCDYKRPLRFEDRVEVRLGVLKIQSKSVTYAFAFYKLGSATGPSEREEEVARGQVTAVSVARSADGKLSAVALPAALVEKLQRAQEE
jgi:YbgC/YbaW family acyl-CoA thioester hydrolase